MVIRIGEVGGQKGIRDEDLGISSGKAEARLSSRALNAQAEPIFGRQAHVPPSISKGAVQARALHPEPILPVARQLSSSLRGG